MLDSLIAILVQIWDRLIPFFVIDDFDKGVRLRFGKFKSVEEPGFHWKIPFADEILVRSVVMTTINLPPQSLATKDDKNIVVSAVVKYKVCDVKIFLLDVWDTVDAISDMTQGIIKKVVMSQTWDECRSEEFDNEITKKARVEAKKCGIEIMAITLANLAQIKSIRLFNDSTLLS